MRSNESVTKILINKSGLRLSTNKASYFWRKGKMNNGDPIEEGFIKDFVNKNKNKDFEDSLDDLSKHICHSEFIRYPHFVSQSIED